MEVQKDFKHLLESFNNHDVAYAIVGAYALAFHGYPRYTGDLDIVVKPDSANAKKIIAALKEFGFESLNLAIDDFTSPGKVVQLGVPPIRIDILTSLTGVTWKRISAHKQKGKFGDMVTYFIGKNEFVANKKALGRHKDLADIESIT
jgi:hypothetical protein